MSTLSEIELQSSSFVSGRRERKHVLRIRGT